MRNKISRLALALAGVTLLLAVSCFGQDVQLGSVRGTFFAPTALQGITWVGSNQPYDVDLTGFWTPFNNGAVAGIEVQSAAALTGTVCVELQWSETP
jgi:hypothetical protein